MAWAVLQHVAAEGPGTIAEVAAEAGIALDVRRLYDGDPVPDADDVDGVVVLGGPMGALDDDAHPHLADERTLLAAAVDQGLPVLGVCLGAQLLAVALGAQLIRLPRTERSIGHVRLTREGRDDPVLGSVARLGLTSTPDPELLDVVHWHRDTFTLPPGAVHLARSAPTPHQAFRMGRTAYGLQFHVEASQEWGRQVRPLWRDDVPLDDEGLARVERTGRPVLGAFVRLALPASATTSTQDDSRTSP